jgi:hypothetical protein
MTRHFFALKKGGKLSAKKWRELVTAHLKSKTLQKRTTHPTDATKTIN